MGDISIRGRSPLLKGGRASLRFGGGRTNLLEQLGRVEAERSNPNRRAEISRVHSELNKGYKDGGRIGFKEGTKKSKSHPKGRDPGREPHMGSDRQKRYFRRDTPTLAAEGGRIGFKKGTDKNWIQKVNKSIKKRKTKGKCTPITKPGCTGRAKALAKTFKKMAAKRKA